MLKRKYDIGWSDLKRIEVVKRNKGLKQRGCISVHGGRSETRSLINWQTGPNGQDFKERLEEAERHHVVPSERESQREKSHLMVRRWESEMHESWGTPVESVRNHVATDGWEFQSGGERAVGRSRRGDGTDAWDAWYVGS